MLDFLIANNAAQYAAQFAKHDIDMNTIVHTLFLLPLPLPFPPPPPPPHSSSCFVIAAIDRRCTARNRRENHWRPSAAVESSTIVRHLSLIHI